MPQRGGSIPFRFSILVLVLMNAGCGRDNIRARGGIAEEHRIPTGARLDPAGPSIPIGSMPLAMVWSPDSSRVLALTSGYREQGLVVVDPEARRVVQRLIQPSAFLGLAFTPDGRSLYVSGGGRDVVYRYTWAVDSAALADSISLDASGDVDRYPAGIAVSSDGRRLYVAENLSDSLAVLDLTTGDIRRLHAGPYPYGVAVGPEGRVFVSTWGGSWVATYLPQADGHLVPGKRIRVGRHPSAMALNRAGTRLFVARASFDVITVVDTERDTVMAVLSDAASEGPAEGATPNGLALSPDGRRLYVAEADNNATAIFQLGAITGDLPGAVGSDSLLGRVPVEWYPTAVLATDEMLYVLNGKGGGAGPNPERGQPGLRKRFDPTQYTLGQTTGTLTLFPLPEPESLDALSRRVRRAEGWDSKARAVPYPPFKHVIYVIKENRTYDQILGDMAEGDGDTSLVYFPRSITPNHHALAERFGLFDRFFVNAEVSADGHNWTTAAYAPDYLQKTTPSTYSGRGRPYDYQGHNRDVIPEDDVSEPGRGYLWDAVERAGVTLRNYGEFTYRKPDGTWTATKPFLAANTCPDFPGYELDIPDQKRVDVWLREFREYERSGTLPSLTFLWLPNDHTAGGRARAPTPRAYVADNDLALGRVIEVLSHSIFWKDTVVFVVEDDAQDGPDHVDSHRSLLLVISAYNRPGVYHRFVNTTDVVATIIAILGLESLSQFDYFGRPLSWVFASEPDLAPYEVLTPAVSLDEKNPAGTAAARATERLDLAKEDAAEEALFNQILWAMIKGPDRPYPGPPEH